MVRKLEAAPVTLTNGTPDAYLALRDKAMWRGKSQSGLSWLWDKILGTDLTKHLIKLDIPVYFFHDIYDYTVSYVLAKKYFNTLQAPIKEFYIFEKSAHSPLFEEPEKMQQTLKKDVLVAVNNHVLNTGRLQ